MAKKGIVYEYVDDMSQELYEAISDGRADFLRDHKRFEEDITISVERLEEMLYNCRVIKILN